MIEIQTSMSQRAVELLNLPKRACHILVFRFWRCAALRSYRFCRQDIGCGSGLSGEVLTDIGHSWVGVDISPAMLGMLYESKSTALFSGEQAWHCSAMWKAICFAWTLDMLFRFGLVHSMQPLGTSTSPFACLWRCLPHYVPRWAATTAFT